MMTESVITALKIELLPNIRCSRPRHRVCTSAGTWLAAVPAGQISHASPAWRL